MYQNINTYSKIIFFTTVDMACCDWYIRKVVSTVSSVLVPYIFFNINYN